MSPGSAQHPTPPSWTLADLARWTDNGATWRPVRRSAPTPLIELCTCYGEAVDLVEPAADLIEALARGLVPEE